MLFKPFFVGYMSGYVLWIDSVLTEKQEYNHIAFSVLYLTNNESMLVCIFEQSDTLVTALSLTDPANQCHFANISSNEIVAMPLSHFLADVISTFSIKTASFLNQAYLQLIAFHCDLQGFECIN